MTDIILLILLCHFLGDFPLQQIGPQAIKKSKSIGWLTIHALCYSIPFSILTLSVFTPYWVAFNVIAHWLTDFFTSKLTSYFWQTKRINLFWITIGVDQLIHAVILIKSYEIFVGF